MTSVADVRTGLAARLSTIAGLRAVAYAADRVSPPAAVVALGSIEYDATFSPRGVDVYTLTVRIYASRADDRIGQDKLDSYLAASGANSIKLAIEADKTLGGIAETCRVLGVENYGAYEVAGVDYYGADLTVTVWVRRS